MAYEATNWKTRDRITAQRLNHAEQGIADNDAALAELELVSDINPGYLKILRRPLESTETIGSFGDCVADKTGKILRNQSGYGFIDEYDGRQNTSFPLRLITGKWDWVSPSYQPKLTDAYPQLEGKITFDPSKQWCKHGSFVVYTDTNTNNSTLCATSPVQGVSGDIGQTLADTPGNIDFSNGLAMGTVWYDYGTLDTFNLLITSRPYASPIPVSGMVKTGLSLVPNPPASGNCVLTSANGVMSWKSQ
jgi:hypothetical protein